MQFRGKILISDDVLEDKRLTAKLLALLIMKSWKFDGF